MKTVEASRDEVILWTRFPDAVGLWTVLGWEPQPAPITNERDIACTAKTETS